MVTLRITNYYFIYYIVMIILRITIVPVILCQLLCGMIIYITNMTYLCTVWMHDNLFRDCHSTNVIVPVIDYSIIVILKLIPNTIKMHLQPEHFPCSIKDCFIRRTMGSCYTGDFCPLYQATHTIIIHIQRVNFLDFFTMLYG